MWTKSHHSALAAWVFTPVLLVFLLAVAFWIPEPLNDFQLGVIRFVMALIVGFAAYFFSGGINLKGTLFGQRIAAGGGFALFLLVQFFGNPVIELRDKAGDLAPSLVHADERMRTAQEVLHKEGKLQKNPDGKRDSATTSAIQQFQTANHLPVNGVLTTTTYELLRSNTESTERAPESATSTPMPESGFSPPSPDSAPLPSQAPAAITRTDSSASSVPAPPIVMPATSSAPITNQPTPGESNKQEPSPTFGAPTNLRVINEPSSSPTP